MLNSVWAKIHNGHIELDEAMELPEGAKVLVTVITDEESNFWQNASESSLAGVWSGAEDDVYAQLLDQ